MTKIRSNMSVLMAPCSEPCRGTYLSLPRDIYITNKKCHVIPVLFYDLPGLKIVDLSWLELVNDDSSLCGTGGNE